MSDPRDSWQPEVDEVHRRLALVCEMGGPDNVARQRAAGRLTVRDRIACLLDPGSFHETGALAGVATYQEGALTAFRPANFVMGTGRIDGRRVVVGGDDFTVRGGAGDASIGGKQGYAERMARELKLPLVRLVDGTGGGGSVRSYETAGRTYVPGNPAWDLIAAALSEIPVVAAALGPVAGLGAARVAASHFSVMVRGLSQVFIAGPPVVKRGLGEDVDKETLGGSHIHARESGVVDNEAETEDDAFVQIRRFLTYLPANVWGQPLRSSPNDDPARRDDALIRLVPRNRRHTYDARGLLVHVVDRGSLFEIARHYGPSLVTALARLDGYPVGILANDPRQVGGALTAAASEKLTRFVDLCDTFHLPVVNFVDQPGFLIGVRAERAGTVRKGVRALAAVYQATVPWLTVIVRRVFGVAGAGHANVQALNLRYAWPSGDWGSLPLEGGIEAAYRRELEAAPDRAARMREIEARLNAVRSPFRTAEAFGIEEIIDPRDTRPLLCDWVPLAYVNEATRLGPKTRGMRP
ncbi:MAG: methylmalonyl-CoA carboxyltransferase [Candidatus Rokuibacteriota bacterium]|nr:MAG: methylmalonyl-CoA carboxyltransferase [Candidatus Rokubacteria bacterium]